MSGETKISENPLFVSWVDSAWIPVLNQSNVMDYFSERTNPFYDRTCNNEILKMQKLGVLDAQLGNMQGPEYCLLHVQEPILYVIRKQIRHSPTQVTPVNDYYIIAGVIYQAPDIGSVLNSRILTGVSHLQSAFEEARGYARYHPSRGYWWDFGKEKEDAKKEEKDKKEEPSSMFQRRRVDMLLDQLTRQFPHKVPQPQVAGPTQAEGEAAVPSEVAASVKSEKVEGGGVKRERQGEGKPDSNSKKIKVER
eukprot:GFUD01037739.1.p1 GENE.GFUD01037739.1~~GFUD01037739.1.p1  ORF type:complete len:251 (+),score=86.07 GFUD01037739.1:41-793(+)